ncbi:MAG: 5-formyltetrahydrofolate cyclo-ligase [Candidatus Kryptonium sp.]
MDKKLIREKVLSIRNSLSPEEVKGRSRLIFQNLKTLPIFNTAKIIHTYVSSKKNEVETIEIINYLFSVGKRVVVPVIDKDRKVILHSELKSISELKKSTFGILEPEQIKEVSLSEIDLVLVPAIAVDRSGNRVGFGGGYYDKFLSQINCPKVALVYDFQVVDKIEVSPNDVPVDFIVTETEIINCKAMKQ